MIFDLDKITRENVRKMTPYSSARDEFKEVDTAHIFLDANESPFENNLNRYPDSYQNALKKILSQKRAVPIANILCGNGSDEILDLLFRAFCQPQKDNIILFPPTYGMYGVLASLNEVTIKNVLLDEHFDISVSSIISNIDVNTKIIFICSPNNPTGNLISVEKIHTLLKTFHGLVVIDEAYIDFVAVESWSQKLNDYPNLVVTQTFSKAYGLAALRLGICFANKAIINILNRIKPPYNVNAITQKKAIETLQNTAKIKAQIQDILTERDRLKKILKNISFIKKIYPSDANFLLVKVDDADKRYKQLIKNRVVVRNRNSQPLCENTLRITVGTRVENEKLIEVLQEM